MNKLSIIKGDSSVSVITFTDQNGNPINLTGYTVFFTAKSDCNIEDIDLTDANAVIKKTITVHSNPTQGETTLTLSPTDTDIEPGIYYWDLQLKSSTGVISSTTRGELEIIQDITQRTT